MAEYAAGRRRRADGRTCRRAGPTPGPTPPAGSPASSFSTTATSPWPRLLQAARSVRMSILPPAIDREERRRLQDAGRSRRHRSRHSRRRSRDYSSESTGSSDSDYEDRYLDDDAIVEEWFTPEGGISPQWFRTPPCSYAAAPGRRLNHSAVLRSYLLGEGAPDLLRDHKQAHNAVFIRVLLLRVNGERLHGAMATSLGVVASCGNNAPLPACTAGHCKKC